MSNLTGTGKAGLAAFGCLLLVGTFLGLSLILAKLADQAGAPRLTFRRSLHNIHINTYLEGPRNSGS